MSEKMPSYVPSPEEIKKANETMTEKQARWSKDREMEYEMHKMLNIDSMEGENVKWGEIIENTTWDEAQAKAVELGLRLPTLRELLYAKKNDVEGFKKGCYWTSTKFSSDHNGNERVCSVILDPEGTFGFTGSGIDYKTEHNNARFVGAKELNIED